MKKLLMTVSVLTMITAACSNEPAVSQSTEAAAPAEIVPVAVLGDKASGPVYTKNAGDILALSGFDAVSYFEGEGTPVEGDAANIVLFDGYEYRFSSVENAQKFAAEPAKYVPAYGGNCAWAAANGKLAPGNPQNYKIVDGTLYLNFNDTVQQTWLGDIPGFIDKADTEYPKFDATARYDDI